jgi:hypothetical protein
MTQLSLTSYAPSLATTAPEPRKVRPTIEERFASWSIANRHVLEALLAMAHNALAQGAEYLSVKKLWEEARVSLSSGHEGGFRLNNDFSAPTSRWLIEREPRLANVIRLRARKS